MISNYCSPRVFFATAGTATLLLIVLLGLTFTRTSPSSFHIGTSKSTDSHQDDLLQHASNETLGFQKIFVINLSYRYDHRDSMSLAAALTGLQIEYVDGVTDVNTDYLPPSGDNGRNKSPGAIGAWRAHMNVLRKIIEQNITSALVLEGDIDWDLRIKSQMRDFAKASRLLLQPLLGTTDRFLDPTYPRPSEGRKPQDFNVENEVTSTPTSSPYGDLDRWDLLWLGHCGGRFPRASDENTPLGRAVLLNDETVPEPQHIDMQSGNHELMKQYPPHTRVVSRSWGTLCTLAYGISQPGARRFFYELAVRRKDHSTDVMFQRLCDGKAGRKQRTCLTVQPQLFQHHRPVANTATFSEISSHGDEWNEVAFTRNVRWSTRLNFMKLVDGESDYVDLFRDGEEADESLGFG